MNSTGITTKGKMTLKRNEHNLWPPLFIILFVIRNSHGYALFSPLLTFVRRYYIMCLCVCSLTRSTSAWQFSCLHMTFLKGISAALILECFVILLTHSPPSQPLFLLLFILLLLLCFPVIRLIRLLDFFFLNHEDPRFLHLPFPTFMFSLLHPFPLFISLR